MSSSQPIQQNNETSTIIYNRTVVDTTKTEQLLPTRVAENGTPSELSRELSRSTTNSGVPRRCMFARHEENPESCQIIWCDEAVHNESDMNNRQTHEELLKVTNNTKLFDNTDECQQFIQQTQGTITYVVCSTSLAERFVLQIYEFQNIRSIYTYCPYKVDWATEYVYSYIGEDCDASEPVTQSVDVHEQHCLLCDRFHTRWTANYLKVKTFDQRRGFLMLSLAQDVKQYIMHEKDGIISGLGRQDRTTDEGWEKKWWPHFLELLCQLPYPSNSYLRLVTELKNHYAGKESELRKLEDFEYDYTPERAINWYTRDSIIFRLLNRALRQQNIELIFLFGFYVRDIYRQLKTEYEKQYKYKELDEPIVRVYRSQIMSSEEAELLSSGSYNTFSVNSFLSTSLNCNLAVFYLEPAFARPEGFTSVLFEIELDTRKNSRVFADISDLSQFSEESEVLCMMGIDFRRKESSYNPDDGCYTVKLELFDDISLKEKKECRQGTTPRRNLHECCRMFIDDSREIFLEDINTIFNELCKLFPSESNWLEAHRYRCLAIHQSNDPSYCSESKSEYIYYEKAVNIWENYKNDSELNVYIDIGDIHLQLASYQVKNSSSKNEHLDLAIASYILSLNKPMIDQERAQMYRKLSETYRFKRSYDDMKNETCDDQVVIDETDKILHYRNLELEETLKFCAPTDERLLTLYENIALEQKFIGYADEALVNFEKVIQYCMDMKNEIDRHIRLWNTYKSIIEIYRDLKEDDITALHYQLLAIENIRKLYSITVDHKNTDYWHLRNVQSNKSIIAAAYFDLADIYIELDEFELARENLLISKKLYEANDKLFRSTDEKQLLAIEEKMSIVAGSHKD